MNYATYDLIIQSPDGSEFDFTSVGPNGEIEILVQFGKTNDPNIVHMGFGNLLPDGSFDTVVKNGNNDRDKILATVASAVYEFTFRNPQKLVVFSGSTPSSTRLYRMAITVNFVELSELYDIYGLQYNGLGLCLQEFKKNNPYVGFAVKRKSSNLHV